MKGCSAGEIKIHAAGERVGLRSYRTGLDMRGRVWVNKTSNKAQKKKTVDGRGRFYGNPKPQKTPNPTIPTMGVIR